MADGCALMRVNEGIAIEAVGQEDGGVVYGGVVDGGNCGVPVGLEVGPIQGDDDLLSGGEDIRDPMREQFPDIEPGTALEPVNLLDGVPGVQPARLGQARAHRVNGQRDGVDHADHGVRHRLDPLGVQTLAGHPGDRAAGAFDGDRVSVHVRLR